MIYAIDFGTSNSLLGAAEANQLLAPIPLDTAAKDPTILRSVLFFSEDEHRTSFGNEAIQDYIQHSRDDRNGRLIRSVKKFLPQKNFNGTVISGKNVTLEDIIASFLREMRQRADRHFGQNSTAVVLGRPARFSDDDELDQLAQDRLEKAAQLAGFNEIHFCPEPIAAAYEFRATLSTEKTVLVADFGGGTSDFTVIKLKPVTEKFAPSDVLAIGGLAVAGDALDGSLMRKGIAPYFGSEVQYQVPFASNVLTMPAHLMERICSPADISLLRKKDTLEFFRNVQNWALNEKDRQKMDNLFMLIGDQIGFSLFEEIERTKKGLGSHPTETFRFAHASIDIEKPLSHQQFTDFTQERIERILKTIDSTLQKAGLKNNEVDLVCATGGTAKVPFIRQGLIQRFGSEKVIQHNHFHSITQGLAHYARNL